MRTTKMLFLNKIFRKVRKRIVNALRNSVLYHYIYKSYWHYLCRKNRLSNNNTCYYSALPNPGAGIGHQIANWIAGYWFAKQFGLKYAYLPFSNKKWDDFLGFKSGEITVDELIEHGYKIVKLPLFDENNLYEYELNKKIIKSYSGEKIIFIAEQDQSYKNQFGVINEIKNKFYSSPSRVNEKLLYSKNNFNIAIHVRRGDIMIDNLNPNLTMRFSSNNYFENVLKQILMNISINKPIHIYFFSQGKIEDFPEFKNFANLHWCLDMNAIESFLHFVYADLLITSKSSFSYKPALLNNGIKICPRDFWHGYPNSKDWILCDNDGIFDVNKLKELL